MNQGVLSFPLFPDTPTEPSAAGARRGVCNCIQTTILLGPPAEGRPGPSDDNDDDDNDDDDGDDDNDDDDPFTCLGVQRLHSAIDLSPDFPPVCCRIYKVAYLHLADICKLDIFR